MKNKLCKYSLYVLFATIAHPLFGLPFEIKKKTVVQADGSYLEQDNSEKFEFELKDKDGKLLGRVSFQRYDDKGYIAWLGIEEAERGKGLGKKLLTQACAQLKSRGCKEIYLYVMHGSRNIVAVNLYKKLGFKGNPDQHMKLDC